MVDEQKLRQLADQLICHPVSRGISEVEAAGEAIKYLLDELQSMREERTAWRVTAENAEAAVKQAREDALTVAAAVCRLTCSPENSDKGDAYNRAALDCEYAIESLKGKT